MVLALPWMAPSSWAAGSQTIDASALPPIEPPRQQAATLSQMALYLAVRLNTRDMGMQPAQLRSDGLWMLRDTLLSMGLKPDALKAASGLDDGWIALTALRDANVKFDATQQALVLTVPFEDLGWSRTEIVTRNTQEPRASASPGVLVIYDLFGYTSQHSRALNAATETRLFRANSVLSNTLLTTYTQNNSAVMPLGGQAEKFKNVRLDTTFSQSFQEDMVTLRVGDLLSGALPWTRATRMGGIQIARNFGLQPYRITTPVPALMGTSAVPSDIALYINGVKQYQGNVPAGPFTLNTVPGINGQGNAQVVLTDALGRSTTLQYSLYSSPQLLAKGLSDWSAELGWVRKNYGIASADYGSDVVASGSYSYGLTDRLTVQGHSEIAPHLANASSGMAWQLGSLGIVSAAAGASSYQGKTGTLMQLGQSWTGERYFTNLQGTKASENFRDAASLYDTTRVKASARAMVGYTHPTIGSISVGAIYLRNFNEAAQRYATLGWSRSFSNRGYMNFSLNRNLDDSKLSNLQFTFNWYLDERTTLGGAVSHQAGENTFTATASQRTPAEGGWGWNAQAQSGTGGGGLARVDYRGQSIEANATVSRLGDTTSAGLGASGAFILMDGHAFASRRVSEAFAVVTTSGIPDVPVLRANSVIGHTNADGVMLVPQLGAYLNNKISINTMNLPAQTKVPVVEQQAVPTDRAGVLVKFDIQRLRSATVLINGPDGQPLPLGTLVTLKSLDAKPDPSGNAAPVSSMAGYDGATYFESMALESRLDAYLPDGSSCRLTVAWPDSGPNTVPVIGPLPCERK